MRAIVTVHVADLPAHGMGPASPSWWGTAAFMLIEGTGFALALMVYLYLMSLAPTWPLEAQLPDLLPGTLLTIVLLTSIIPNIWVARAAGRHDLRQVRIGLIVMTVAGVIPMAIRPFEFPAMHIQWDGNAYGSVTWLLLGLHTTHVITDVIETVVLTCLMYTGHADNPRRYGDVQDNAMYWNFVVLTWLPIYACLYWVPRL